MPVETTPSSDKAATLAHERSRAAIIDPSYSVDRLAPAPDVASENSPNWLYGEAELECWQLHRTVEQGFAAAKNVHYARNYHRASNHGTFRLALSPSTPALPRELHLRVAGDICVSLDQVPVYRSKSSDKPHVLTFPASTRRQHHLDVEIVTENEPPAFLVLRPEDSTITSPDAWSWSTDGLHWASVSAYPQTRSGLPPHLAEEPTTPLSPISRRPDGLWDFGREIFGRLHLASTERPRLSVGESVPEALEPDEAKHEQRCDIDPDPDGGWVTRHPLGFRYLRLDAATPDKSSGITCQARFHPVRYRGAFACSDERLTRIWMHAAYTLRLCMQGFMLDGVKRDRMPWIGDQALNLISNAYTFADAPIVRRSFTALGRLDPSAGDINGIVDYTLWWIINNDVFQQYFAQPDYLRHEWPRIQERLASITQRCDSAGFLITRPDEWVFIDWGNERDIDRILTPLQILWYWAQKSAAALARRINDNNAAGEWAQRAEDLASRITHLGWNLKQRAWRHYLDADSHPGRIVNALAVLSGLATPDQYEGIRATLASSDIKPPNTPFMTAFELMAASRLGLDVLPRVSACWGAMLDQDASTFWEECVPGTPPHAMYERPFGKSLCHAWSSGPAALLPLDIFGLRPLADGWALFSFAPRLGALEWATATIPTPHGDIEAFASSEEITLKIPNGAAAQWNDQIFTGPQTLRASPSRRLISSPVS